MKETYYAIRIGDPRRHSPYLMLEEGKKTPALFMNRSDAEIACPDQPRTKVVRAKVTFMRSH